MKNKHVIPFVFHFAVLSGPAMAEVKDLMHSGLWDAFGGVAEDGHQVCGMSSSGENGTWFGVKWFSGNDHLTVQATKTTWSIPSRTNIRVVLQFDRALPWTATASGFVNRTGLSGIEFTIPAAGLDTFLNELRYSLRMTLSFPDGTELPWLYDMDGTNEAVVTMANCIKYIAGSSASAPTQPYGNTQPYSISPTQPFLRGQPPVAPPPMSLQPRASPQPGKT
ncbi:MAG: hypothetical protein JO264_01960 [Acidisphaera sp.]|nr:hypothetical protein [Acidisphaera sp.]